ncbi:hypothetical protein LMG23992_05560 [Cupriavidus laharis]|uniref:Transposase n=1 Tax=Cupriavidus laharis TaxID=151654 RepID=A0ABN7ZHN1_9BURK|nr:hypothetical protein LMG23992_05560 [Cupriavidus laharis]
MVILNALFAWLTEAGYLAGNPLALARRRRAPTKPRITRYLGSLQKTENFANYRATNLTHRIRR